MKSLISFLLLSFIVNYSYSQINNNLFILLNTGDTIKNIKINNHRNATNENHIKYTDSLNNTYRIKASKVSMYFDGIQLYYSENIKDTYRFIYYYATGHINIGMSKLKTGKNQFWLKKGDEIKQIPSDHVLLNNFFKENLEDFDAFLVSSSIKLKYGYKSLGEIASSYNSFKYPEKYVSVKYQNKKTYHIGIAANPLILSANNNFKNTFQTGAYLKVNYTPNVSFKFLPSYYKNEIKNNDNIINLNTFNTDFSFNYNFFNKGKTHIAFDFGLGIVYHFNSFYTLKDLYVNSKTTSLSHAFSLNLFSTIHVYILKNLSIDIGIYNYRIDDVNIDLFHTSPNVLKKAPINITDLRIGLSYQFLNFYQ